MDVDGQHAEGQPDCDDRLTAVGQEECEEAGDAMETSSEGGASSSTLMPSSSSTGAGGSQTLAVGASGKTEFKFKLLSPMGGRQIEFTMVKGEANRDVQDELIMHLQNIFKLGLGIKEAFEKTQNCEWSSLPWSDAEKVVVMVQRLNKCIGSVVNLWRGATRPHTDSEWFQSPYCNAEQAKRLSFAIFNRVVKNAQVLNKCYKSFSSLTYGETSFDQVQIILDRLKLTEKDVFLDLGSGVGHVVTYAAAYSMAKKCIGIEINKLPAMMAEKMKREFVGMMSWYGKKYRPFELKEGDFLKPEFRNTISEATVIFINNYAFDPELMFAIKDIIKELDDGVKIVCTKSFSEEREERVRSKNGGENGGELVGGAARKDRGPNLRALARQPIDQMLDCEELPLADAPVSWSAGKGIQFLLFTVNRSKIEKMFESAQNSSSTSRSGSADAVVVAATATAPAPVFPDDAQSRGAADASISATIDAVVKARQGPPCSTHGGAAARRDANVRLYADESDEDDEEYAPTSRRFGGVTAAEKKRKGRDDEYVPKKRSSTGASASRSHKKSDAKKDKSSSRRPPQAIVAAASDNATPMHSTVKDSKVKKEELRARGGAEAVAAATATSSSSDSDGRVYLDRANPMDRHLSKSRGRPRKSDAGGGHPSSSKKRRHRDDDDSEEEDYSSSSSSSSDDDLYEDDDGSSSTKENQQQEQRLSGPAAKKARRDSSSSADPPATPARAALPPRPVAEPEPRHATLQKDFEVAKVEKPASALHCTDYKKEEVPEWVGTTGKMGSGSYVGVYAPHHSIFEGDPHAVPEKRVRKSIVRLGVEEDVKPSSSSKKKTPKKP